MNIMPRRRPCDRAPLRAKQKQRRAPTWARRAARHRDPEQSRSRADTSGPDRLPKHRNHAAPTIMRTLQPIRSTQTQHPLPEELCESGAAGGAPESVDQAWSKISASSPTAEACCARSPWLRPRCAAYPCRKSNKTSICSTCCNGIRQAASSSSGEGGAVVHRSSRTRLGLSERLCGSPREGPPRLRHVAHASSPRCGDKARGHESAK